MMTFATAADAANQDAVARELEAAWNCEVHRFGDLDVLDFYASRDGRLAAVGEIKCRGVEAATYETVFFSVRKFTGLVLASVGVGVPALFVVRFLDQIRWTQVGFGMGEVTIAGRYDRGAHNDIEPLIEVPIAAMRPLGGAR